MLQWELKEGPKRCLYVRHGSVRTGKSKKDRFVLEPPGPLRRTNSKQGLSKAKNNVPPPLSFCALDTLESTVNGGSILAEDELVGRLRACL